MSYDYPFNTALDAVTLPVFMQAPLKVALCGDPVAIPAAIIDDWVAVTELWFSRMQPKGGGRLWLDLILMSSVTSQPMPLLRLRKLYLDLLFIDPPLPVQAADQGNSALAK